MPSPELMKELVAAFEAQHARLVAAQATAPPGPLRDHLTRMVTLGRQTFEQLRAGVDKHNDDLAAAARTAQETLAKAEAEAAEQAQNRPKPRARAPRSGVVPDPHLEEKLQLALHTPFGNRHP